MTKTTPTTPAEVLARFCANENDLREYLRAPWRNGAWVYATNGHIIIRVPSEAAPEVAECDRAPSKVGAMFAAHFTESAEFLLMPELPALFDCPSCEGAGRIRATKCNHCEGEGGFTRLGLWYDCKNCEGDPAGDGWVSCLDFENPADAVVRVCTECDGLGHRMHKHGITQIGEGTYSPVYLHWIAALPQARVMPGDAPTASNSKTCKPLAFLFDGGQGLLQPRKE